MTQPNLSRVVRENPEEYRGHVAGIFAGEAAKRTRDLKFVHSVDAIRSRSSILIFRL